MPRPALRPLALLLALALATALAACGDRDGKGTGAGPEDATPPAGGVPEASSPAGPPVPALEGVTWTGGEAVDLAAADGRIKAVQFFKPT